jgi:hypothetical protein
LQIGRRGAGSLSKAGCARQQRRRDVRNTTEDGIKLTWAVNHLAPFLLSKLLLHRLKESAPARIITTASQAHQEAHIPFDDLNAERSYRGFGRYGETKLANILFTTELARRLDGTGVTASQECQWVQQNRLCLPRARQAMPSSLGSSRQSMIFNGPATAVHARRVATACIIIIFGCSRSRSTTCPSAAHRPVVKSNARQAGIPLPKVQSQCGTNRDAVAMDVGLWLDTSHPALRNQKQRYSCGELSRELRTGSALGKRPGGR